MEADNGVKRQLYAAGFLWLSRAAVLIGIPIALTWINGVGQTQSSILEAVNQVKQSVAVIRSELEGLRKSDADHERRIDRLEAPLFLRRDPP